MKRVFALIMLAMLLLSSCSNTVLLQDVPELLVPVEAKPEIAAVLREDVVNLSVQSCTVVQQSEPVKFAVDGLVSEAYVFPGQTVQEGDVLAVLQVESMQEQLESLQTQLAYAQSSASMTYRKLELAVQINQMQLEELLKANLAEVEESQKQLAELEEKVKECNRLIALKKEEVEVLESQTPSQPDVSNPDASTPEQTTDSTVTPDLKEEQIAKLKEEILLLEAEAKTLAADLEAAVQAQNERATVRVMEEKLAQTYLQEAQYNLAHAQQDNSINMETLSINIRQLQERIENATLYAPVSGVITWISDAVYSGGWFSSEDPVMFISDPEKLSVHTAWIDPHQLERCEKVYAWIGDQEYELQPDEASLETDVSKLLSGATMSSTFHFAEDVEIPDQLSGLLFLQYGHRDNVISIPTNAIFRDQSENFVYKMVDNRRERVEVEVGLISAIRCEIISGLEEGDIVYVTE